MIRISKFWKKHYNFNKLKEIVNLLTEDKPLPNKYKNHYLKGDLQGNQECHIGNNTILIYQIFNDTLTLIRIDTNKDLLNK